VGPRGESLRRRARAVSDARRCASVRRARPAPRAGRAEQSRRAAVARCARGGATRRAAELRAAAARSGSAGATATGGGDRRANRGARGNDRAGAHGHTRACADGDADGRCACVHPRTDAGGVDTRRDCTDATASAREQASLGASGVGPRRAAARGRRRARPAPVGRNLGAKTTVAREGRRARTLVVRADERRRLRDVPPRSRRAVARIRDGALGEESAIPSARDPDPRAGRSREWLRVGRRNPAPERRTHGLSRSRERSRGHGIGRRAVVRELPRAGVQSRRIDPRVERALRLVAESSTAHRSTREGGDRRHLVRVLPSGRRTGEAG